MAERQTRARLGASALATLALLSLGLPAGGAPHAGQAGAPVWNNPPQQPIPGVEHRTFHSASMETDVGYSILLPPGYPSSERRYPVVYWLHGLGGNESSSARGIAPLIIEAMEAGGVPPLIVVFVNGGAATFYVDSPDGRIRSATAFIDELIPHVDATYRTVADRSGRAIEGMSMGGFGALAHGMKHPELFGSVVAYAPALLDVQETAAGTLTLARAGGTHGGGNRPPPIAVRTQIFETMFGGRRQAFDAVSPWAMVRNDAARLGADLPLRIVIGTADGLWNAYQLFHELLLEHRYEHELAVVDGVAHNIRALYEAVGVEGLNFHTGNLGWR